MHARPRPKIHADLGRDFTLPRRHLSLTEEL
jgi:hypothetical protein